MSGQDEDVEERLIGLGLPWGLRRMGLTVLPLLSAVVVPDIQARGAGAEAGGGRAPDLSHPPWFWAVRAVNLLFTVLPLLAVGGWLAGLPGADALLVLWVLPNLVRHASIVFLSSSSHYTGIPRGDLMVQNQVLDHPVFWPAQLFCWNFGATHILHHFVVGQPFWRRTLVWPRVRPVLRAQGIRFNDLGTFGRANRWAAD